MESGDLDGTKKNIIISTVTIPYANASNAGTYTCIARIEDEQDMMDVILDLYFKASFINASTPLKIALGKSTTVKAWCIFEGQFISTST